MLAAEDCGFSRVELTVRSSMLRGAPTKGKLAEPPGALRESRESRPNGMEARVAFGAISAKHKSLGGSPLDPRLTFETFIVRALQWDSRIKAEADPRCCRQVVFQQRLKSWLWRQGKKCPGEPGQIGSKKK
jgi:hypothetical protein